MELAWRSAGQTVGVKVVLCVNTASYVIPAMKCVGTMMTVVQANTAILMDVIMDVSFVRDVRMMLWIKSSLLALVIICNLVTNVHRVMFVISTMPTSIVKVSHALSAGYR